MTAPSPLAEGITVLEASAGTGKTHRVTSEALRAIAGGTPLEHMLLVTFTIAATSELRSRVWERLALVAGELRAALGGAAEPVDDVAAELAVGSDAEVAERLRRLDDAAGSFDAATITTIHGFCLQMLRTLGFAADVDREPAFLEDIRDLRDQVVEDLVVQRLHAGGAMQFPLGPARIIADKVTTDPRATVWPADADRATDDGRRVAFARAVRNRLDIRKRRAGLLGYDDLLLRVEAALADDPDGTVRSRLRGRFTTVIVDEFQDTDAIQWRILRSAFGDPPSRLVLVGDPKQAIYAFRGADVHAYLAARREAGANTQTLDVNWRSDAGLLRGLDALFGTVALGHDEIVYASTRAAPGHVDSRLAGTKRPAPIRLRLVPTDPTRLTVTPAKGIVQKDSAIAFIAGDLASDIVRLLGEHPTLVRSGGATTPVAPGDIAVLVGRNQDAITVRDALVARGVPAVVNGAGSVFSTPAAGAWLAVLRAVEQPAYTAVVREAALTSMLGWTVDDLVTADEARWDRLHERLHDWGRLLHNGNVAALFERLAAETSLSARLLATENGERELTDLRHLTGLLHEQAADGGGVPALLSWLRERIREADRDNAQDDRSRRLETDEAAVQVWTVHRSKGLEYPIVYVPFLWTPTLAQAKDVLVFHDADTDERIVDVSLPGGDFDAERRDHVRRYLDEEIGGQLRLAYVALTRAQSQVVLWWARGDRCHQSPLATLLCTEEIAPGGLTSEPADKGIRTAADLFAHHGAGTVSVEVASGPDDAVWTPPAPPPPTLDTARFSRTIDRRWRRTSYSALTAAAHDAPETVDAEDDDEPPSEHAPEHSERGLEDEWMPDDVGAPSGVVDDRDEARLRAVPSVFGDTGGGARFGTLVHAVLEAVDFAADDLPGAIRAALAEQYTGALDIDRDAIVAGLVAAVETPLGPLVDDLRLRDVRRPDRLDELHFEFPLVGGDDPSGTLTMQAIADVVSAHLPADDLLGGYGDRLRGAVLDTEVRGHLSGSIDVVLRHDGRFFVIDHKSNWLGTPGEELSAWHYRPAAMRDAMVRAHYPLQALLYAVALHRYLRWRLPTYDPDQHLGGVLYLFLRGMNGAEVARVGDDPCGVFSWRPPAALIAALSDVFDRGTP